MAVSPEVRDVEDEIDERVRALPLWRKAQAAATRAVGKDGVSALQALAQRVTR